MKVNLLGKDFEIRKEYVTIGVFILLVLFTLWGWYLKTNRVEVFDAGGGSSENTVQPSIEENGGFPAATTLAAKEDALQIEQAGRMESTLSQNTRQTFGINLNTATAEELIALNGIGQVKAEAIIAYRKQHGAFKTIEEIKNVKGIGDATFEKIKGNITIDENTSTIHED